MVMAAGSRRIGVLGLAFKTGTDDLRESPMVTLIERLIGKGMQLAIYDRDVSNANVIGANREYVEREIPHIWDLMRSTIPIARGVGDERDRQRLARVSRAGDSSRRADGLYMAGRSARGTRTGK